MLAADVTYVIFKDKCKINQFAKRSGKLAKLATLVLSGGDNLRFSQQAE